ncbi:AI-2E family transporter [Nitrosomonas ureae]|uniref:Predicted PurR-regulated permease PerM n=1 Tax=Nitrosomonas ureae TaxID=44577 RepID=A0A1H5VGC8_9PROT|nr:AI-2E family transporter [Nitrosomonas ureae]SEF86106.1 Predicted PurR-regulated permease PerM [Nitrosomonas ureae]
MTNENKVIRVTYIMILSIALLVFISPFFIPLIFASTIALTLYPVQLKLESKGMKRNHVAALLTTLFTTFISIPFFYFIIKGTDAVTTQLEKMSFNEKLKDQGIDELVLNMHNEIVSAIQKFSSKYDILEFLNEKKINHYLEVVNNFLLDFFREVAASLPALVVLFIIMILCTYSFLGNAEHVKNFFQKITGFSEARMQELTNIFIRDSRQVYLSNIVTGGVQSLMVAAGVSMLQMGDFFVVLFVTLILSFIPIVGAAPVAFIFAILAFFKDSATAAIILGVLGILTSVVDNILRSWIATFGKSKIPPIVAFVCVIGGALLFGFPGLFIGLFVGAYAFDTLPIFWDELNAREGSGIC